VNNGESTDRRGQKQIFWCGRNSWVKKCPDIFLWHSSLVHTLDPGRVPPAKRPIRPGRRLTLGTFQVND
jgi:hypothetical protein